MALPKASILGLISLYTMIRCNAGNGICAASIGEACPPDWNQWCDKCYKLTKILPWSEAKEECLAMGGVMVVPQSDEETNFLMSLQSRAWIGCNDLQTGSFVCQEGKINVDYRNWDRREPDNFKGGEHCVAINLCGEWADKPCDEQRPAICKRPTLPQLHL